jgi:Trk K+ transport system NAD-binding subunit
MNQPVVLCGLGQVGRRVLDCLHAAGIPVVVIDNRCQPDELRLDRVRLIHGDFRQPEILAQADLARARGVLILTSDDLVNISGALLVRQLHADVRIVVRLFNQNLIPRLGKAVTNVSTLGVSSLTSPLLALTALTGQALGTFQIDDRRYQIAETIIHETSPLRGLTVAHVASRYEVLVVAHGTEPNAERFLHDVDAESRLAAGHHLVVCGEPRKLAPLLEETSEEALPHLRWAGWLRRVGRILYRTWAEIDLSVQICTTILLAVVFFSTLVYHFGVGKTVPDSLYRTISVMATGADMHEKELPEGWQKVFVSVMRIFGAALIAAFTAIVTNYLLRARLRGALEIRRIPDSGHVVVCGLGNVGFRVVEELLKYETRVVVVEPQRDGRFMAAARRLNVAIIIGDATVQEVLRQAHAATAHAVIAATNNELANLEIALLVRELNPQQRVVVRLNDPRLSETLRVAANVRLALALPALAAPAFVAALFGDRVQTVFLVKGQLLAVLDLVVPAGDSFLGSQTLRSLAIDYGLMPVSLREADPAKRPNPMDHQLAPGDRLTVIASLNDLNRLLRRQHVPADWVVEVTDCTLPAKPLLAQLLREQGRNPDEAAAMPLRVSGPLTRGQAEQLLGQLTREGVKAHLCRLPIDEPLPAAPAAS